MTSFYCRRSITAKRLLTVFDVSARQLNESHRMKLKYLLLGVALTNFAVSAANADWKQITTEAGYISALVGKDLIDDDGNTYRNSADGKFSGRVKGGPKIRGAWQWHGNYWCRNVVVGTRELGTDCQKVEINGNRWRITRKKGKGGTITGTIR